MKLAILTLLFLAQTGCDSWCKYEQINMANVINETEQPVILKISFFRELGKKDTKEYQAITVKGNEHFRAELFRSEGGRVCGNSKRLPAEEHNAYLHFEFDQEEVSYIICKKVEPEYKYGLNEFHLFTKDDNCPDNTYVMVDPEPSYTDDDESEEVAP